MELSEKTLPIQACPKCGLKHNYKLAVKESFYMANISPGAKPRNRKIKYTRLFTCPTKNEDFQATFSLIEYFGTTLEGVTVAGVVTEIEEREGEQTDEP